MSSDHDYKKRVCLLSDGEVYDCALNEQIEIYKKKHSITVIIISDFSLLY